MAVSLSKRRPRNSRKTEDRPEKHKDHRRTLSIVCPTAGDLRSIFWKILYRVPLAILLLFLVYVWSSSTTVISGNVVHICLSSRKLNNLYCLSAGSQPSFHVPISGHILHNVNQTSKTIGHHTSSDANKTVIGSKNNHTVSGDSAGERVPDNPGVVKSLNDVVKANESNDNSQKNNLGSVPDRDHKNEKQNFPVIDSDLETREEEEEQYRYLNFKNDHDANAVKTVEKYLQLQRLWRAFRDIKKERSCEGRGIYVYDLPSKFNKDLLGLCEDMVPWAGNLCSFLKNDAFGEPIEKLGRGWYRTHQYSLEPIFHTRVLKHPCRVYDETQAKLFYVPFYGGLDVLRWHFKNVSDDLKDNLGIEVIKWLGSKRSWKRNSGKDHVFVLGKICWDFRRRRDSVSWGSRLLELQEMQNPTKLLIERNPWHVNDIAVPHPTYFHPKSDAEIENLQIKIINKPRRSLIGFAGGARPGQRDNIRSTLIDQCKSAPADQCRYLDCTDGGCDEPATVIDLFQDSEFCLQPPGDSPTRKSVFDSLISGCIPVIFDPYTAYYQYTWHFPEDHRRYSVYIRREEVRDGRVNVVERLVKKTHREKEDMRSYIVHELLPGLLYGDSDAKFERFRDAFDITMNNLIEKVSKLE